MIKITVPGAAGKMGKTIIEQILKDTDLSLIGAVEFKGHDSIGESIGKIKISDDFVFVAKESDAIIDFTTPEATLYHLEVAQKYDCNRNNGYFGIWYRQNKDIFKNNTDCICTEYVNRCKSIV